MNGVNYYNSTTQGPRSTEEKVGLVYIVHVNGARLRLSTSVTNGPTVYLPDDIRVWRYTV
jgi:hypothetical protein